MAKGKWQGALVAGLLMAGLVVALAMMAGCGPAEEVHPTPMNDMALTAQDDGSRVELKQGQTLVVSLESNPTTGYSWEVSGSTEPVLRQVGEVEFEPKSDLIGAPGVETLRFQAVDSGETTLQLVYHRPWEAGVAPLETFAALVIVP